MPLFSDDRILYIENPKDSTKRTAKINKFSEVAGYKIYIQKSVVFLYTNNEICYRNKENNPIYNNIKNNKFKETNLTKEVKFLYT